jgi:hypothetical protein
MSLPISEFMLSRSEELLESTEIVTHGVAASSNQARDSDLARPPTGRRVRRPLDTEYFRSGQSIDAARF